MKEVLENLKKAILEYDGTGAESWAREAVKEGIDPLRAFDALTEALQQVGDGYGRGELWLPDLVGAASAMQRAAPIIEEEIEKAAKHRETLGAVVIGTVFGDIHDIGKSLVAVLLTASGFKVIDLGINIKAEKFVLAVREHSPDILAMSALMTMTAPEQGKVINTLREVGLKDSVKVMVGGSAITQEFAESIGADGYAPTAPGAVNLAKRLVKK